jgi:hypothetical protein
MREPSKLIGSLLIGAGAMYLLDPDRGNRRRSLARDKSVRLSRKLGEGFATAARDFRNRSAGAAAELKARLRPDLAGDEVIEERVRSELGRVVSHPGSISVTVLDGRVILSGPVRSDEVKDLLAAVGGARGVREIENQLEVREDPDRVPGLQGGRRRERRPELLQDHWAPATRVVVGALAGSALLGGMRMRGPIGGALSAGAAGLLARAAVNQPLLRAVRTRAGDRVANERPEDRPEGVLTPSPDYES